MNITPSASVTQMSNGELLGLLVGDSASLDLAHQPLADLFCLHPQPPAVREAITTHPVSLILEAAKELIYRAMHETVRQTPLLSTPELVRNYLKLKLADRQHEVFCVLALDNRHQLIADIEMFRGTLTQTSVYPREIVKVALENNAASVIFAHNHPSGAIEPSQADILLTQTLKKSLALVDVRVVDHFIIAGNEQPLSMAERGLV